ncbi:MAG TPA: transglutaminase family protein [Solirubrobacteraceae bacterium]|jgi:hypothetical protein|nr:transglutaminase family protein [Solirubrobacteraceae bacterium]
MSVRLRFACEYCNALPDPDTQRSLRGQLRDGGSAPYLDALPGRWLVWRGGGRLGPRRYACATHRGELTAYLRQHYAAIHSCVWQMPPYAQVTPAGDALPEPAYGTAHDPMAASPLVALARGRRPAHDELLLALAAEFRPTDAAGARERLDDCSRALFGLGQLDAAGQAGCVSHALQHDLDFRHARLGDPDALFLDCVLERRRGHPLLLVVIAVELARRAGVDAELYSAPPRLFAGFGEAWPPRLVEFTRPTGQLPPSDALRRHCAAAVAFGILAGLSDSYARMPGRANEARRAGELQHALREGPNPARSSATP